MWGKYNVGDKLWRVCKKGCFEEDKRGKRKTLMHKTIALGLWEKEDGDI